MGFMVGGLGTDVLGGPVEDGAGADGVGGGVLELTQTSSGVAMELDKGDVSRGAAPLDGESRRVEEPGRRARASVGAGRAVGGDLADHGAPGTRRVRNPM